MMKRRFSRTVLVASREVVMTRPIAGLEDLRPQEIRNHGSTERLPPKQFQLAFKHPQDFPCVTQQIYLRVDAFVSRNPRPSSKSFYKKKHLLEDVVLPNPPALSSNQTVACRAIPQGALEFGARPALAGQSIVVARQSQVHRWNRYDDW